MYISRCIKTSDCLYHIAQASVTRLSRINTLGRICNLLVDFVVKQKYIQMVYIFYIYIYIYKYSLHSTDVNKNILTKIATKVVFTWNNR